MIGIVAFHWQEESFQNRWLTVCDVCEIAVVGSSGNLELGRLGEGGVLGNRRFYFAVICDTR